MRGAGFATPRIAVAALNPHGGRERPLRPRGDRHHRAGGGAGPPRAASRARGRFPSDTVFLKAFGGEFDGVLSMYHDQGQIATKLKGFNRGVTVTAGLGTVFTTPAHGTAFDIVGKGVATTGALEQAVRLARASLQAAETPHREAGQCLQPLPTKAPDSERMQTTTAAPQTTTTQSRRNLR